MHSADTSFGHTSKEVSSGIFNRRTLALLLSLVATGSLANDAPDLPVASTTLKERTVSGHCVMPAEMDERGMLAPGTRFEYPIDANGVPAYGEIICPPLPRDWGRGKLATALTLG